MSKKYQSAGVSLTAGYESVDLIKKHVKRTYRTGMMGGIGSFGGMFDLSLLNYKNPILVSGTDGVGTKLIVAIAMDKHDTIGEDLVAMCVNDVLAQGAEPLFFLDYIAIPKTYPKHIEAIVSGIANGCVKAGCSLIGGETAEMPDMYAEKHYDLAGFTVGVVEKDKLITGDKVEAGDVLIGLPSSGCHSNGYSLVRKIIMKDLNLDLHQNHGFDKPLGDVLLTPTRIYTKPIGQLFKKVDIHSLMHITGGGFYENLPRGIKENQGVLINEGSWPILPIFKFLEEKGNVPHNEMYEVFNMGIGLVLVVNKNDATTVQKELAELGEISYIIGQVTDSGKVEIK